MKGKLILVIAIAVLAVLIGGSLVLISKEKKEVPSPSKPSTISAPTTPSTPEEEVDEIVKDLLQESTEEESILNEEENDASLITTDSNEIDNFSQSVKEDEF